MIELGRAHSSPSNLVLPALVVPDTSIIAAEADNAFDAQWIEKWTQVTGDVAVFDRNWTYSNGVNGVFNQERWWDGQATMEAEHAGKPIIGARYWFAPIGRPNGHKKTIPPVDDHVPASGNIGRHNGTPHAHGFHKRTGQSLPP